MTIRTSSEAIHASLQQHTNVVGTCQKTVHEWFDAPSVGDVDHDGDADAVDGWESEPKAYRHPGDRHPPDGVPLAFSGGSRGYGHRCMSGAKVGNLRSTDMFDNHWAPGITGTVHGTTRSAAIAIIEQQMGVSYLGWSETMSGFLIPNFKQEARPEPKPQTRGVRVDRSIRRLRKSRALAMDAHNTLKVKLLTAAIDSLLKIPTHDKKN
jgi:hypothetical protein